MCVCMCVCACIRLWIGWWDGAREEKEEKRKGERKEAMGSNHIIWLRTREVHVYMYKHIQDSSPRYLAV